MSGRFRLRLAPNLGTVPRPIRLSFWTTIAWAGFSVLAALFLLGYKPYVHEQLIKSNDRAKKPTLNYTGSIVDRDVSRVVYGGLTTAILSGLILVLLAFMVLRARGLARWTLVLLATVLPIIVPFGLGILIQLIGGLSITDAPLLYRGSLVAAGLCSAAVLVFMLLPETSRFFAANRAGPRPARAARPARPKSPLFGGRSARAPLFGQRAARIPMDVAAPAVDDEGPAEEEPVPPARPRNRKGASTRPGALKPKGASNRPVRAKSRNQ